MKKTTIKVPDKNIDSIKLINIWPKKYIIGLCLYTVAGLVMISLIIKEILKYL